MTQCKGDTTMSIYIPETKYTYWTQIAFGIGVAGPYVMLTTADSDAEGNTIGATIDHFSLLRKLTTGRRFAFLRVGSRRYK